MRCNACWREIDGRAITTTCGHLLCAEDASKILGNDGACPICDQVLSKSLMKPVDTNPSEDWTNMAMAGISPQILMKSAYRSVMFYIGQKELEMQFKMNRLMAQCRQKCEAMQENYTEKMEQAHTAYKNMTQKCQIMQQEIERVSKDNQELQEKLAEKSRQKRKLDEMYDQLKAEYESAKRAAIQPARGNFYTRPEPDFFADTSNMMGSGDPLGKDGSIFRPQTPGPNEDIWPARQNMSSSKNPDLFDISGGSTLKQPTMPSNRKVGGNPNFGGGGSNPSMSLRNLIFTPIKRPQLARDSNRLFSL